MWRKFVVVEKTLDDGKRKHYGLVFEITFLLK